MIINQNVCKIQQSVLYFTFLLSEVIGTVLMTFADIVFVTFVDKFFFTFIDALSVIQFHQTQLLNHQYYVLNIYYSRKYMS